MSDRHSFCSFLSGISRRSSRCGRAAFLRDRHAAAGLMTVMLTLGSLTGLSYVGNHAYLAYQRDTVRGSLDAAGKVLAHDHMARLAKFRASGDQSNTKRNPGALKSIAQNFVDLNLEGSSLGVTVRNVALSISGYEITVEINADLDDTKTNFKMNVPFMPGLFGQAVDEFKSVTTWETTARPLEMVLLMETSQSMLRPFKAIPSGGGPPCRRVGGGQGSGYFAFSAHTDAACRQSRSEVAAQIVQDEIMGRFGTGSPSGNVTVGISMAMVPYGETVNLYNDQYRPSQFYYRERINEDRINFDKLSYSSSSGSSIGTHYELDGAYPKHPNQDTWAGCVEVKPGQNTAEHMDASVMENPRINARSNPPNPDGKFWDVSYREIPGGPGLTSGFLNAWQAPDLLSGVDDTSLSWNAKIGEVVKVAAGDKPGMSVVPDTRPQSGPSSRLLMDSWWRQPQTDPAGTGYSANPGDYYAGTPHIPARYHHNLAVGDQAASAVHERIFNGLTADGWELFSQVIGPYGFINGRVAHETYRVNGDLTWYRSHKHGDYRIPNLSDTTAVDGLVGHNQGCHRMPIVPLTYDLDWIRDEFGHFGSMGTLGEPTLPNLGLLWAGRVLSPAWNMAPTGSSTHEPLWLSPHMAPMLHRKIPASFQADTAPLSRTTRKVIIWIASTDTTTPDYQRSTGPGIATTGSHGLSETRYAPGGRPLQHTEWSFEPPTNYARISDNRGGDQTRLNHRSTFAFPMTYPANFGYQDSNTVYFCRYSSFAAAARTPVFPKYIGLNNRNNDVKRHGVGDREALAYSYRALSPPMSSTFADAAFRTPSRVTTGDVHCITPRRPVVWCQSDGSGDYSFYSGLVPDTHTANLERIRQYLGVLLGSEKVGATTQGRDVLAFEDSFATLLKDGSLAVSSTDTVIDMDDGVTPRHRIAEATASSLCGSGGLTPILYCEHHLHEPGDPTTRAEYARYAPDMNAEIGTVTVDMGTTLGTTLDVGHELPKNEAYRFCGYGDFTYTGSSRSEHELPQVEMLQLMPNPDPSKVPAGLLVAGTSFNVRFAPIPVGHLTFPNYGAYGRIRHNSSFPHTEMPPGDFFSVYATYLDSFAHQMLVRTDGSTGLPNTVSMREDLTGPTRYRYLVDDASAILGYRANNRFASRDSWELTEPASTRFYLGRAAHYMCQELQHYGVDMYGIRIVADENDPSGSVGSTWSPGTGQKACFRADPSAFYLVDSPESFAVAASRIASVLEQQLVHTEVE